LATLVSLAALGAWGVALLTDNTPGQPGAKTVWLARFWGFFLTGASAAAWTLLSLRKTRPGARLEFLRRNRPAAFWLSMGALALALAAFVRFCGMRFMMGFDHGCLIESCWRVAQGQSAGVDYPMTHPPGWYLVGADAFRLLGVSWSSLVWPSVVFTAVVFLWLFWLARRLTGETAQSLLAAACLPAMTTCVHGVWYYNPVAACCAVLVALSALCLLKNVNDRPALASYAIALLALAFCKINVAGLVIALVTLALATKRGLAARVLGVSAAAFAVFWATLAAHKVSLPAMIGDVLAVRHRGAEGLVTLDRFFSNDNDFSIVALCLLPFCAAPFLIVPAAFRGRWRETCVILALAFSGLHQFLVSGETKLVSMATLPFAGWLWLALARRTGTAVPRACPAAGDKPPLADRLRHPYCAVLALCLSAGLGIGFIRGRTASIPWFVGKFFEYGAPKEVTNQPFFAGMKAGPSLIGTLDELNAVIPQVRGRKLWFHQSLNWVKAAYGLPSERNELPWWEPWGFGKPEPTVAKWTARWLEADYDALLFHNEDFYGISPAMAERIRTRYRGARLRHLTVFIKNGVTLAPPPPKPAPRP
jgi:hypothetical protein